MAALHTGSLVLTTVFPRLISHPRLVPQCGTNRVQTTLIVVFILIVAHPRIILQHDINKIAIIGLPDYKLSMRIAISVNCGSRDLVSL